MDTLQTEFLFDLRLEVESPVAASCPTPAGDRKIHVVRGGTFEGPRMRGVVLPGGTDWGLTTPDRIFFLDVRAVLKTEDGSLVTITYRGLRDLAAEDYWRTTPVFETTAEPYKWLTRIVAVGVGTKVPTGVHYRVYRV